MGKAAEPHIKRTAGICNCWIRFCRGAAGSVRAGSLDMWSQEKEWNDTLPFPGIRQQGKL